MSRGFAHHRARRLEEAEHCYRRVLELDPAHAEAQHHLGLVLHQRGQPEAGLALIRQALAHSPRSLNIYFNLATVLRHLGRTEEAEAVYRALTGQGVLGMEQALVKARRLAEAGNGQEAQHYLRTVLAREPEHVEANYRLGVLLGVAARFKEALTYLERALAAAPGHVEALSKRGLALMYLGRTAEARGCFDQALALNPGSPDALLGLAEWHQRAGQHREALPLLQRALAGAHKPPQVRFMLANSLAATGQLGDAEFHYRRALEGHPNTALVHNNLAECLFRMYRLPEAMEHCRLAIAANPRLAEPHANLGNLHSAAGRFDQAVAAYQKALALNPDSAGIHNNLANVYLKQFRFDEALATFRKALELKPDFVEAHSNILYLLTYQDPPSRQVLFEAHVEFGRRHADPVSVARRFANVPDPERRLRVGFVSADFRDHPVATFIEALFRHHDAGGYEFIAYSDVGHPDAQTQRLRQMVEQWTEVCGLSHEQLAERVMEDRVDILVDLTGHMANHRLMVFARKPAPVQVSYMGYLNTTGLRVMDYWLTDEWVNPPETQAFHTERFWYLPRCFVCYTPPPETPPVAPPPMLRNKFVTFGVFNNASKIQPGALKVWVELLRRLPESRLLLKAMHFADPPTRQRFLSVFTEQDIAAERVHFLGPSEKYQYLQDFGRIDVALDTFPNNGNTTTHDTLWMGVPVVALKGNSCVSRVGYSILRQLGHEEWVADSGEDYLRIAMALARDPERLKVLRTSLRGEMTTSRLCDAAGFTRDVEQAFRGMWRRRCEQATAGT